MSVNSCLAASSAGHQGEAKGWAPSIAGSWASPSWRCHRLSAQASLEFAPSLKRNELVPSVHAYGDRRPLIEMLAACRDYSPNDQTGSRVWTSIPRSPGGCLPQSFTGLLPLHLCVSSLAASWNFECCTSCTCRLLTNLYNGHVYLWNINDQVSSWAWAELLAVTNALQPGQARAFQC